MAAPSSQDRESQVNRVIGPEVRDSLCQLRLGSRLCFKLGLPYGLLVIFRVRRSRSDLEHFRMFRAADLPAMTRVLPERLK